MSSYRPAFIPHRPRNTGKAVCFPLEKCPPSPTDTSDIVPKSYHKAAGIPSNFPKLILAWRGDPLPIPDEFRHLLVRGYL